MKREKVSNDPFCILGIVLAEVNFSLKHTLSIDEVLAPYGGLPMTISKPSFEGTEKTVIAKKLKVSKTTFYRYLVYTGLHTPINCQQEGWKEYGIYH